MFFDVNDGFEAEDQYFETDSIVGESRLIPVEVVKEDSASVIATESKTVDDVSSERRNTSSASNPVERMFYSAPKKNQGTRSSNEITSLQSFPEPASSEVEAKEGSTLMENLKSEIERFKISSAELDEDRKKLRQSMARIERMQAETKNGQIEFNREITKKREEFDMWMQAERRNIEKDRMNIEREKRRLAHAKNGTITERKDRVEIESLKQTIVELKKEKKVYVNRSKNSIRMKETKIKKLEETNEKLNKSLLLAEEQRIDACDKQVECERLATETIAELEIVVTENEALRRAIQKLHENRSLSQSQETETIPLRGQNFDTKSCGAKESEAVFCGQNLPGAKFEAKHMTGTGGRHQRIEFGNGSVKEVMSDGTTVTTFANGDRLTLNAKDGSEEYYYSSEKIRHIKYANGKEVLRS